MELLRNDINSIFVLKSHGFNNELITKPRMKGPVTPGLRGFYIMTKRAEYKKGDLINGCVYLNDIPGKSSNRKAEFKCPFCENTFKTAISHVIGGHTRSCGCLRVKKTRERSVTHGQSNLPLYYTWKNIIARCYKKTNPKYYAYGARGITICDEWREDPSRFIEYISALPDYKKDGYSLDRIDNDGNYERGNLRWTTSSRQMANRRKVKNESGFTGVRKMKGNWQVRINVDKEPIHLGTFEKIEDAVKVRNDYIVSNNLETFHKVQEL